MNGVKQNGRSRAIIRPEAVNRHQKSGITMQQVVCPTPAAQCKPLLLGLQLQIMVLAETAATEYKAPFFLLSSNYY